jgi:predicted ATPase
MSRPGTPLRFTHVYLESWRNFTHVDTDLGRRVLLVGPNASGKTNLLDVFRFLRELCAGGFQAAVRRRGGVSRLRCLSARQHSEVAIAFRVRADEGGPDWEYELRFAQESLKQPTIRRERVTRAGEDVLVRPDEHDERDPERLTQTALEQLHSNREFRDLAEFFGAIRYANSAPVLVREPRRPAHLPEDPFGGDLLERIGLASESVQRARLRRILDVMQAAVPHLQALEFWRDPRGAPHLRARYGHWRPAGAWQTEHQFSDGTLRLLALLWEALDGAGLLLLEEPEISLHPKVVRELLPILASVQRRTHRQVFLTTHSKELLAGDRLTAGEILLLIPHEEGTEVRPAFSVEDAPALLEGCLRPEAAGVAVDENQLDLFGPASAQPEPEA